MTSSARRGLRIWGVAASSMFLLALPLAVQSSPLAATLTAACLASVIALTPFLKGSAAASQRPVWVFATGSIVVGSSVRVLGSIWSDRWGDFFYGTGPPSTRALIYFVAAITSLTYGYTTGFGRSAAKATSASDGRRVASLEQGLRRQAIPVTMLVSGAALVAVFRFVVSTGGFSVDNLSAKRGIFLDLEAGSTTGSLILLRAINELPLTLAVLFLGAGLAYRSPGRRIVRNAQLAILSVAGLSIPFVASQREVLVSFFSLSVLVVLRRSSGSIRWTRMLAGTMAMLLVFGVISSFRSSRTDSIEGLSISSTLESSIDGLVRNRNLADMSKTTRIVDAVPEVLDFDNGERQFGAILGIVPRSLWPSKPVIGAGPEVSAKLYGIQTNGIPPGLVAESFWSFGWLGLVPILALGYVGGRFDRSITSSTSDTEYAARVLLLAPLLLDALGVGLGNAVVSFAIRAFQLSLVVLFLRWTSSRRAVAIQNKAEPQVAAVVS